MTDLERVPSILDPKWKYESEADSKKPGYLARKFAKIAREQKTQMPVTARAGSPTHLARDTSAPNKVTKIKAAKL